MKTFVCFSKEKNLLYQYIDLTVEAYEEISETWFFIKVRGLLEFKHGRPLYYRGRGSNQNRMVAYVGEGGVRIFELFCGRHK